MLNKAGVTNQVVFCDLLPYVDELRVQRPRHIGRRSSVVPVHQRGAFHPKVYLLLGSKGGRALVGSGNTTIGGTIRNAEVFGQFDYRHAADAAPHPIFGQLTGLIRQLLRESPSGVGRQVEQGILRAAWLNIPAVDDGRRLLDWWAREAVAHHPDKRAPSRGWRKWSHSLQLFLRPPT